MRGCVFVRLSASVCCTEKTEQNIQSKIITCRVFSYSSMVKVPGQNSNRNTAKLTIEKSQKDSGDDYAVGILSLAPGIHAGWP